MPCGDLCGHRSPGRVDGSIAVDGGKGSRDAAQRAPGGRHGRPASVQRRRTTSIPAGGSHSGSTPVSWRMRSMRAARDSGSSRAATHKAVPPPYVWRMTAGTSASGPSASGDGLGTGEAAAFRAFLHHRLGGVAAFRLQAGLAVPRNGTSTGRGTTERGSSSDHKQTRSNNLDRRTPGSLDALRAHCQGLRAVGRCRQEAAKKRLACSRTRLTGPRVAPLHAGQLLSDQD
ncbi:hypothetical protein T45_04547 [Streptomyces turgidiscabies]|nr:hypothetical protein T45_04547 [Streptomyces turgidiscabies]